MRLLVRQHEALTAVVECDPKGAKAYLGGLLKGPSEELREEAEVLIKGLCPGTGCGVNRSTRPGRCRAAERTCGRGAAGHP